VLGVGLRQVQDALNKKADEIQHQFVAVSEELETVGRKMLEVRGEDRAQLQSEQTALRAKQAVLADEVNLWRERARAVVQQRGESGLRAYMAELEGMGDPMVAFSARQAIEFLDAPEEALERFQAGQDAGPKTPAGRLLVWRAALVPHAAGAPPGTLVTGGPGALCVATGEGLLLPIQVQPENRKAMAWEDFLRGARLGAGARLTEIGA